MEAPNRFAQYPQVNFRAGELEPALRARGASLAVTAQRDLARYYQVLADELRALTLSEGAASLLVDALNGALLDERSYRHLHSEVADAIAAERLDEKWGVDAASLLDSLLTLTPGQRLALVDAAERFWQRSAEATARGETLAEQLRAVGLLREPAGHAHATP